METKAYIGLVKCKKKKFETDKYNNYGIFGKITKLYLK